MEQKTERTAINLHDLEWIGQNNFGGNINRLKVPGGWVYSLYCETNTSMDGGTRPAMSSTFVPEPISTDLQSFASIPDPAAFVERAKKMEETLKKINTMKCSDCPSNDKCLSEHHEHCAYFIAGQVLSEGK